MKLHFAPGSPFSRIVRVLLRELEIPGEEAMITEFPPAGRYFVVNPTGQVPALETVDGVRFPTRLIIDYLMDLPRTGRPELAPGVRRSPDHWQDEQVLAVLLLTGDALAAIKHQAWSGLGPVGDNLVGYDPAERHAERVLRTLDWLETLATPAGLRPEGLSVQDIALSCFLLWTDARGGFPWRGRPKLEQIVAGCAARPSFLATQPQPWP